jgi:hypothetical protein
LLSPKGEEEEEEKDNSTTTAMKISRAHIVPTQIRNVHHHRLDKLKRSHSSPYENVYTPTHGPVPIFILVNVVVVVLWNVIESAIVCFKVSGG